MTLETVEMILEYAEGIGIVALTARGSPEHLAARIRARLDALKAELDALTAGQEATNASNA
jgi:hypothetical protein